MFDRKGEIVVNKKIFLSLFLLVAVIVFAVPVSVEASGGTVVSTIVPQKDTSSSDTDDDRNVYKEEQQSETPVVTNTKSGSTATSKTGDDTNVLLWVITALGSIGILAGIGLQAKISKHHKERLR